MSIQEQTEMECPQCGKHFSVVLWGVVEVPGEPDLKKEVLSGKINQIICPECGFEAPTDNPLVYVDRDKHLVFYVYENIEGMDRDRTTQDVKWNYSRLQEALGPEYNGFVIYGYLLFARFLQSLEAVIEQPTVLPENPGPVNWLAVSYKLLSNLGDAAAPLTD